MMAAGGSRAERTPRPVTETGRGTAAVLALLLTVRRDNNPLRGTLAVNSKQDFTFGLGGQAVEVRHRVYWLALDALDHVARLQTRLGRRTIGVQVTDDDSVYIGRQPKLVADGRRKVLHLDSPQRPFRRRATKSRHTCGLLFQLYLDGQRLAVPENPKGDFGSGTGAGHHGAEAAYILNAPAVEAPEYVAVFQSCSVRG